ncbi:MAG: hypothetical protein IPN17_31395 [Deltaproteobacteria bacterium]|nr:hypothetical protein [Deltaproteobacteria bacterium]
MLIFTEFADTRAWLVDQLRAAIDGTDRDDDRIGSLHGSQDEDDREAVKQAFNASPEEHPLRILVATDAAREGINLQAACADLFHFDLPWNPARIEQRNGRIDRMLQPEREVRCHYFRYRNLPEDAVLARLATKSHAISAELGSFAPVVSDRILAVLSKGLSRRELAQRIAEIDAADEAPDATRAAIRRELDDAREKDLRKASRSSRSSTTRPAITSTATLSGCARSSPRGCGSAAGMGSARAPPLRARTTCRAWMSATPTTRPGCARWTRSGRRARRRCPRGSGGPTSPHVRCVSNLSTPSSPMRCSFTSSTRWRSGR